jgi:hypothetical protein
MSAGIIHRSLEPDNEVSAGMNGRKSRDSKRIENSKHVELAFLRQVRAVSENRKRDVHRQKVEAGDLNS